MTSLTISLRSDLAERLRREADRCGCSTDEFVEGLIERNIEADPDNDPVVPFEENHDEIMRLAQMSLDDPRPDLTADEVREAVVRAVERAASEPAQERQEPVVQRA